VYVPRQDLALVVNEVVTEAELQPWRPFGEGTGPFSRAKWMHTWARH
jgi:hypothetical protein